MREYESGRYRLTVERDGCYYDAKLYEDGREFAHATCVSYENAQEWAVNYHGIEFEEE